MPNVVPNDIKNRADAIFNNFKIDEGYRYTKSFLQSVLEIIPNVTQTMLRERNITDLVAYIQYNNFEVTDSKIYSIFDYLYKQYTEARKLYLKNHPKVSKYDSENLMYSLIEDILAENKYASLDVVCHFPLNKLIRSSELLSDEERRYVAQSGTHVDFLIYSRLGKKPILAIEVDGYEYHQAESKQAFRDSKKNHIFELYKIPLLRFCTNGSGEKQQIIEKLEEVMG